MPEWATPRIVEVRGNPIAPGVADQVPLRWPWPQKFGCTTPGCPRPHYLAGKCRGCWVARQAAIDALESYKVSRGFRPEEV